MNVSSLLARPHLSVITREADYELSRIQSIIEAKVLVDGRGDLEILFGELLARQTSAPTPKTLDLIGHATPNQQVLLLGNWVIDVANRTVTSFFRGLADNDVLSRLGITAVRLLGCQTAETRQGRATIVALAEILGCDVYGTQSLIYSAHYDAGGFRDDHDHVLVGSGELAGRVIEPPPRSRRVLDVDALPTTQLTVRDQPWPRRIATIEDARSLLRLVRRTEGAEMPGLLAQPCCEIAIPSATPRLYHIAQLLFDFEFLRVYPDGHASTGILFPIEDPRAARSLVERIASTPLHQISN